MYDLREKALMEEMWHFEEDFPFGGWDMLHIEERCEFEPLPWDYEQEVLTRLHPSDRLLDMDTGDGVFLLNLRHPYELTSATECIEADYRHCVEQLAPLGIKLAYCDVDNEELPFESNSFDVVLSRHGGYRRSELFRVLRPGGIFITEQIGEQDNRGLALRFLPESRPLFPGHCAKNAMQAFLDSGFNVNCVKEYFPKLKFFDVGAFVYFTRLAAWEFPGFSVDRCRDELFALNEEVEEHGYFKSRLHRFLLVAQKPER